MNEAIRQVALDYLKPPFEFNRGYIFDAEGHMVADDGDWKNHVVRIRGWGAISYLESPEQLQDMIGTLVAEALTEFWQRDTYRALCVELQATVANLHSQIRDNTLEKICCGEPIQDNGYVCCGDEEADWPDWALEAMRTADEMNAKAEQVLSDGKKDPV